MNDRLNRDDLRWTTPWQAARFILVGATVHVALRVALIVGTVLSVVNQGAAIIDGNAGPVTAVRVFVNYLVPYLVSSFGYLASFRTRPVIDDDSPGSPTETDP